MRGPQALMVSKGGAQESCIFRAWSDFMVELMYQARKRRTALSIVENNEDFFLAHFHLNHTLDFLTTVVSRKLLANSGFREDLPL